MYFRHLVNVINVSQHDIALFPGQLATYIVTLPVIVGLWGYILLKENLIFVLVFFG